MKSALEILAKTDYPPERIMGSRNHSYLQSVLVAELFNLVKFIVIPNTPYVC